MTKLISAIGGGGQVSGVCPEGAPTLVLGWRVQGRPFQRLCPIGRGRYALLPTAGVNGEAAVVSAQAPKRRRLERRARQVHSQRLEEKPTLGAWEKEQKKDMAKGKAGRGVWISEGDGSLTTHPLNMFYASGTMPDALW